MDIFSHALWGAIGAKAFNKALARNGKATRISAWWTGFWAAFPDLLAFTPLAISLVWSTLFGSVAFEGFRSVTGTLYPLSHSLITWVIAFGAVWLILRRPAWELVGWFTHIILDIGTHPSNFYPTPFLWPLSDFSVGGIAWATPVFLIVNYALLSTFLYLLRDYQTLREGHHALSNAKKISLALLATISIIGAYSTFARRAGESLPHEPPPPSLRNDA